MDSSPSRQPREKHEGRPSYPKNPGYELYEHEIVRKQKDVTDKKVHYKKGSPTENRIPANAGFQIPESDNSKQYPGFDDSFNKSPKHGRDQYLDTDPYQQSPRKKSPDGNRFDQSVNFSPVTSKYQGTSPTRNKRIENPKSIIAPSFEKEQVTKEVSYGQPSILNDKNQYTNDNYSINNRVVTQLPGSDLSKNSSLICKAINYDGEPVTVNDEVIRDKLILSCRPKKFYGIKRYFGKRPNIEEERLQTYVYPPPVTVIDDVNIQRTNEIDYQYKAISPYIGTERHLERSNAVDLGSLGMGEHLSETEKQGEKYEEQYREIQCKRYARNFRCFLWALFIINTLLVLVGLVLLLLILYHLLFRDYINTVILQTGFVTWTWAALVLAMLIIVVGAYGIITSVTRARGMLVVYCIVASILAIIILIFLLIFWIIHTNLKATEHKSMTSTFEMYRCHRWVRVAWDDLQDKYHCCGIEARGDWKYIPPSCCNAVATFQKLACINHFIQEDQAYKGGCRKKLEDYFTTMFLLITCLLVLAFILLLLGILACFRLLKMYKLIKLCREMYLITP